MNDKVNYFNIGNSTFIPRLYSTMTTLMLVIFIIIYYVIV
jgi:hypothetical protein